MSEIIDYTKVNEMTYVLLEQMEVERQDSKNGRLYDCRVRLLCDNCNKPFVRWLHDQRLAFGFTCSKKCQQALEKRAMLDILKEKRNFYIYE